MTMKLLNRAAPYQDDARGCQTGFIESLRLVECLLKIMVIQTRKRHFEKYIFVHGIGFGKLRC